MLFKAVTFTLALLASQAHAVNGAIEERQSTSCAPLIHFHAAGTSENGLGSVGNALARDLPKVVPGAVVRAINYDTRAEYFTTVRAGATSAASAIALAAAECPDAMISYSGYSKGALVVHSTQLPDDIQSRIVSVAVFGDPNARRSSPVPLDNTGCLISLCNTGDPYCDGGNNIRAHIAYSFDGSTTRASSRIASCFANPCFTDPTQ